MSGTIRPDRREDGIAFLWIDNPAARNAMDDAMIDAVIEHMNTLGADRSCRAVVLRGEGGVFCSGRALTNLRTLSDASAETIAATYGTLQRLNEAVYYCARPTVAVLERYALGLGAALSGWCDIALAVGDVRIGYPEVRVACDRPNRYSRIVRSASRSSVHQRNAQGASRRMQSRCRTRFTTLWFRQRARTPWLEPGLTVWYADAAIAAWKTELRTTRGGQPRDSALAIATALTLRSVFRLALHQTEGLIGSILALLGLDLAVPDYTTLSRRAESLDVVCPRPGPGPVHLLVDSTGLKLHGSGEWLLEKHGTKTRRSWRKLHMLWTPTPDGSRQRR